MSDKLKKALAAGVILTSAVSAFANTQVPTITLGVNLDTQLGYKNQKRMYDYVVVATDASGAVLKDDRLQRFAIVNDTTAHLKLHGKFGNGAVYGGFLEINADTSNNKYGQSNVGRRTLLYVESVAGRIEGGNYSGAGAAMNALPYSYGTGGVHKGDWIYWVNTQFNTMGSDTFTASSPVVNDTSTVGSFKQTTNVFNSTLIVKPTLPTDSITGDVSNAAKVTLYTPNMSGLKAGVSFIPDVDQHGTTTRHKQVARNFTNLGDVRNAGYKNVFQGGISYTSDFVKKTKVKLALLGEMGKAKSSYGRGTYTFNTNPPVQDVDPVSANYSFEGKRHDLRAWEASMAITMNDFTIGGSYGSWGKSGTYKNLSITPDGADTTNDAIAIGGKKASRYWSAIANYEYKGCGLSFGYLNSKNSGLLDPNSLALNLINGNNVFDSYSTVKSRVNAYSLGAKFKVVPGFEPYMEGTYFNMKDKAYNPTVKNNGTVVLVGTRLQF